ncbi:hypothetical protein [Deinococcus cellulosilyticus]|uniref:DUF4139 domain-containing protein n=1 Tax=Deinococcus cellulosilyticus (strain DSM 18568 / NBRC 106333 / KACC 11606 / 5516J-15) TaxID=1223518 RepID=A0A511MY52_DEIC1|nr:hypothetical protein [Deinococcus cellulosilyticus]GEM45525.1 hypothetical protein DC3_11600 [Deinococcus cellulosilyticus NBRC 106333 = KACC 11606]
MKKIMLFLMLAGAAQATELRIYPGFAEVLTPIHPQNHQFEWTVGQEDLCQVIPSSLAVQGAKVAEYTLAFQQKSWLDQLIGKQVTVRIGDELREGTVERIEDQTLFVKELETGRYLMVGADQLELHALPPLTRNRSELQFKFTLQSENKPVLRYFTRNIQWTPRYTLEVNGGTARLTGWADLQNNSREKLTVSEADLFSGNFNLPSGQFEFCNPVQNQQMYNMAPPAPISPTAVADASESRVALPTLTSGGLYRQEVRRPFEIPAQGHLNLALKDAQMPIKQVLVGAQAFSQYNSANPFIRQYRFTAPEFLQQAPISVRDDGVFVGEAYLPETAKGDKTTLNMGTASDVTYQRTVQLLNETRKDNEVTSRTYQVNLKFSNFRSSQATVEYTESLFRGRKGQITHLDQGWVKTGNDLMFAGPLKAGEVKTLMFKVRFDVN